MKRYLVFWINERRIGSVPATPENVEEAGLALRTRRISTESAADHFEVLGVTIRGRRMLAKAELRKETTTNVQEREN